MHRYQGVPVPTEQYGHNVCEGSDRSKSEFRQGDVPFPRTADLRGRVKLCEAFLHTCMRVPVHIHSMYQWARNCVFAAMSVCALELCLTGLCVCTFVRQCVCHVVTVVFLRCTLRVLFGCTWRVTDLV